MKKEFLDFRRSAWIIVAFAVALTDLTSFAATKFVPTPATTAAPVVEDIRDIRGPIHIPASWPWGGWLMGGAVLVALAFTFSRWHRTRTQIVKLPYEIALERLEKVRALMQPASAREYSFAVSEIVRDYVEKRFHVGASRRTTEEFLHDLLEPADALLGCHRSLMEEFLHHCDLAKFARWILSVQEMENMHRSACTFVLETGKQAVIPATTQVIQPV